ncbi:hypothetical protein [Coralloluteibacterium thermophilus]|uniref:Tyrosine specific protein phosphatases domain-containing protein n=1 Tax=Coralloluteibacterium thermophilum TaxID=2707049 RepID=A0ABV9NEZ4_9GAMM
MPRFIAAADRLHSLLATSNTVTLHCVNGKSRTACALLVFLIRHHAVAYAEAATFVTAMQAERRAHEPGFSFDLARQGTTGSYAQWIEAWWRAGRLAVTDANRIHADAWVSVGQRDNKTVYTVQPPPDPLARAPRKRRRSEVEPDPPPSPPRPPPRLRGPTQVDARTVAEGQAWLARMGRNPRP